MPRSKSNMPKPKISVSPLPRRTLLLAASTAVALAATGTYFAFADGQQAVTYAAEDVARAEPFTATHQMDAGKPSIEFLPDDQPQPRIRIPEESYDFGWIGPTAVVERTFVIRNEGEAPLTISRAYTTCGCTVAEISSRVIPPGKVALATVRFDAGFHDTRGQRVQRGLIIESNDRTSSEAEIWINASVNGF